MNSFATCFDLGILTYQGDSVSIPEVYYRSSDLTPEILSKNPHRIYVGDKIQVLAFEQTRDGTTYITERLAFLKSRELIPLGFSGFNMVMTQRLSRIPSDGFHYTAPDDEINLLPDVVGSKLPRLCVHTNGKIVLDNAYADFPFYRKDRFFGFRRV